MSHDRPTSAPRLYDDLARLWSLLSPPEHYADEAATLLELASAHGLFTARNEPPRLLELGAGGGHMLSHLHEHFECTATDLSGKMLAQCSNLVPTARVIQADMRTLRLQEQFDVVLLLDAVDYMASPQDAISAIRTAKEHLAPGGLLALGPTYTRESFSDGEMATEAAANTQEEASYVSYVHQQHPDAERFEMILVYLIRNLTTRRVEVIEDRHQCGLYACDQWLDYLAQCGLRGQLVEDDKACTLFAATHC